MHLATGPDTRDKRTQASWPGTAFIECCMRVRLLYA